MRKFLCSVIILLNFSAFACEKHEKLAEKIDITNIWARQSFGQSKNSAIYMDIKNSGDIDYIVDVQTDIAHMAELHKTVIESGISQMVHIDRLALPKNVDVKLKPKGLHIMLMGLEKPLKPGDDFEVTLVFEKAGKIKVKVPVKKLEKK